MHNTMEPTSEVKLVKHYPTVDEILNEDRRRRCTDCGREFHNSSACRFHELKQHSMDEMADTNETRILRRTAAGQIVIRRFFCPDESCANKYFDGLRYVRQHYIRSHMEKKLLCEHCGLRLALPKDMNYHRRVRCAVLRKQRALANGEEDKPKPKKKKKTPPVKKIQEPVEELLESNSTTDYFNPPIVLIVAPENAQRVLETVQRALKSSGFDGVDVLRNPQQAAGVFAEASTQVQMPFLDGIGEDIPLTEPLFSSTATGPSTSFATQFDQEPTVTFCERGTMMNEEEPLRYFSPPYGEEFGDIDPQQQQQEKQQQQQQQQFDYSSGPSTSSQPQTRSFGTMFENVATCNTGTSMIDETFPDFLRDIHTQTPNGLATTPDWPWSDGI